MTTERVTAFARERFTDMIENFLDDPHGMLMTDSLEDAIPIAGFIHECRLLATDLGLDLDEMLNRLGTASERGRVREMMSVARL